jgi:hypothetical protein
VSATETHNGQGRIVFRLPPDRPADVAVAQADAPQLQWRLPTDVRANVSVAQAEAAPAWRMPSDVAPAHAIGVAGAAATALEWSDEVGSPQSAEEEPPSETPRPLDNQAIYRIIREVAVPLSGDALYSAVAADEQLGLLYGLVLFPQASVHLGSVLRLMRGRAEAAFLDVFGPAADELLAVTGAPTPAARLAAVHGRFLWQAPWPERFRRAGQVEAFQAAQNEEAIEHQFRPMLRTALALGLSTERALAVAYDAVATRGVGGGIRWLVETAGPLRTEQQRSSALRSLGFADVAAFQATVPWVTADGVFGPATHAALVEGLRRQGDAPLPTAAELVATLVEAAEGEAYERLERLEDSERLTDAPVSG